MSEQGLDKNELARIVDPCVKGQDIRGRTIEGYMDADMPQKHTWENIVPYLCRVLLISEDVLYKGHGKNYGCWRILLDEAGGLEGIGQFTGIKDKKEIKDIFYERIANAAKMEEGEFMEWVRGNQEFLREDDYSIYSDRECFDNLLHKEDAFALLEVLEKMDDVRI